MAEAVQRALCTMETFSVARICGRKARRRGHRFRPLHNAFPVRLGSCRRLARWLRIYGERARILPSRMLDFREHGIGARRARSLFPNLRFGC